MEIALTCKPVDKLGDGVEAPAHGFLRKSAIVASGQAFGYALALVASPILSRLYSPLDFGVMAIFVALMSMLGTIATLRYENAIPLPNDERSADSLAALAKWIVALTTGVLLIAAATCGGAIDRTVFRSQDAPFSWLLVPAATAFASCEIHSACMVRKGQFAELSRKRMCFAVTCLATQLSVPLFLMSGSLGLLAGQVAGYAAESLIVRLTARRSGPNCGRNDVRELRRVAMEYRNYPLFDVWSSLLRVLAANGQALLIAWLYGPATAGCLMLAQRLLSTPISMLSFSISRVYYSEAAVSAREGGHELRCLFLSTMLRLALLCAPPLALVCAFAPWTFGIVFGAEWQTAGVYCSLLCPLMLLRVISFVLGPTLDVVHRQGLRLARELICVVLIGIGFVLAGWLGWSELTAVATTTALGCLGYVLAIALTWQALLAHGGHPQRTTVLQHQAEAA